MPSPRFLLACLLSSFATFWGAPAYAQITPDQTLGSESSVVTPDVEVRGDIADVIEGGAARGGNLFHSFTDFNVMESGRVYFANPENIDSILSRVTGDNLSNIFGTLGVDGPADLFLINPNGIVFGPDVSLDVEGSFYATTGEGVAVGERLFGATLSESDQLLSIKPSTSFLNYITEESGNIISRGEVSAGSNVMLAAHTLDLQGQIAAFRDLSLLASNEAEIRDTENTPFIAFAGGDLLVQGNQEIDIVALNHPESGLFSYGDMVLRSATPVGGDAHYFSGGSFRVENLDESTGKLFSPLDPIIRAYGDVELEGYEGTSLHILAGGSVKIGTAVINAPDVGDLGIDFLQESVQLSDGTIFEIDGSSQPTLDIRAGLEQEAIDRTVAGNISGYDPNIDFVLNGSASDIPTSADISIGDIFLNAPDGVVLLSNNYAQNVDLEGNIEILGDGIYGEGINAINRGANIAIDSRNNIELINSGIYAASEEKAGNIVLIADESVIFDGRDGSRRTGIFSDVLREEQGIGSSISIAANNLALINGARINSALTGRGQSGNVALNISETAIFEGRNPINNRSSGISNSINETGSGQGGNIQITASNLAVLNGAQITTDISGSGTGGNAVLNVSEAIFLQSSNTQDRSASGVFSINQSATTGQGGDIQITATNIEVLEGAVIDASTFGRGDAGNIVLEIRGNARFDGIDPVDGSISGAFSRVEANATGQGQNIQINAANLEVTNGANISTSSAGQGSAGSIMLQVDERFHLAGISPLGDLSGISSSIGDNVNGEGGDILVSADNLSVLDGGIIDASTSGQGNAGNIILQIREIARFDGRSGAVSIVQSSGEGDGGNVSLTAQRLEVLNGARLSTRVEGQGRGGTVGIQVQDTAYFEGSSSFGGGGSGVSATVAVGGRGTGGNVQITARNLEVLNGAQLDASTIGQGDAGNVILEIVESARFLGINSTDGSQSGAFSAISSGGEGNGGDVTLTADTLEVLDGAVLATNVIGRGDAGDVILKIDDYVRFDGINELIGVAGGATSIVETEGEGIGGDVYLTAANLEILNGAELSASTFGLGNAGNVFLDIRDTVRVDGSSDNEASFASEIASSVQMSGEGNGGNISIAAGNIEVLNGATVDTSSNGKGNTGNITLQIRETATFSGNDPVDNTISGVFNRILSNGRGDAGEISITSNNIMITDGANISSGTAGLGNAGNIILDIAQLTRLNGENPDTGLASKLSSGVLASGRGRGGNLLVESNRLEVSNGAQIDTASSGRGDAGAIVINIADSIELSGFNRSDSRSITGIFSNTSSNTGGQGGDIEIKTSDLTVLDGSQIVSATLGSGDSGDVVIEVRERAVFEGFNPLNGASSGVFSNAQPNSEGRGGDTHLSTDDLYLIDGATLAAGSGGEGDAGNLTLAIRDQLQVRNGLIATDSVSTAGGRIDISADTIFLRESSNIATNSGAENGGDIRIVADAIVALEDSNILAFATGEGSSGGNIDLSQTTLFSDPLDPVSDNLTEEEILNLTRNERVDVNATGDALSGDISLNRAELVENNLAELSDSLVDPDALVANSCIAERTDREGTFTLSGSDRLPQTPSETTSTSYPVGTVQSIQPSAEATTITEPQAIYQLEDGRLLMSRDCQRL